MLPDIKDAGPLYSLVRYGWPWHGVIRSGSILPSAYPHSQPAINESYLIETGIAAPAMTPDEVSAELAAGRQWLNYALLPKGTVYNKAIGSESFIHVDAAGKCWRVSLAYAYPAAQTLRITATVTEFGVLIVNPPPTPAGVTHVVDVVCTEIEVSNPVLVDVTYTSRKAAIEDVAKNGEHVLIGVFLETATVSDLFALVTLSITGDGGVDGTGLVFTGNESMAQPQLTVGIDTRSIVVPLDPGWNVIVNYTSNYSTVCTGAPGDGPATATFQVDPLDNGHTKNASVRNISWGIFARHAWLDDTHSPVAVRIRSGVETLFTATITVPTWTLDYESIAWPCDEFDPVKPNARRYGYYTTVFESGIWLLHNETVVDQIGWRRTNTNDVEFIATAGGGLAENDSNFAEVVEPRGSLAAYLPATEFTVSGCNLIDKAFRSPADSAWYQACSIDSTTIDFGLHRMNSKATAFVLTEDGSSWIYGITSTPAGLLSPGLPASAAVNFCRNRKTGDYLFEPNQICYV